MTVSLVASRVCDSSYFPRESYRAPKMAIHWTTPYSFTGAQDLMFTECEGLLTNEDEIDEDVAHDGLSQGVHTMRIEAYLPGLEYVISSEEEQFELTCPDSTSTNEMLELEKTKTDIEVDTKNSMLPSSLRSDDAPNGSSNNHGNCSIVTIGNQHVIGFKWSLLFVLSTLWIVRFNRRHKFARTLYSYTANVNPTSDENDADSGAKYKLSNQ